MLYSCQGHREAEPRPLLLLLGASLYYNPLKQLLILLWEKRDSSPSPQGEKKATLVFQVPRVHFQMPQQRLIKQVSICTGGKCLEMWREAGRVGKKLTSDRMTEEVPKASLTSCQNCGVPLFPFPCP